MLDRDFVFFFFNDTATTEIYTLSLHDALPIYVQARRAARPRDHPLRGRLGRRDAAHGRPLHERDGDARERPRDAAGLDRKSTRLNSSHANISYAVFCLKKKTEKQLPRKPFSA